MVSVLGKVPLMQYCEKKFLRSLLDSIKSIRLSTVSGVGSDNVLT